MKERWVAIAAGALAVLIFVVADRVSSVVAPARYIVGSPGAALRVMSEPMLDEWVKEQAVRRAFLHLLKRSVQIAFLAVAILVSPAPLVVGLGA